ncbi:hypothetical protein EHQ12_14795 [Leptospira gomenensis]|uniref:Uncharacterized protein n=1 Tax=Leptospira gomenensis TaxID=2484974 RepID=A0A5F1Y8R8_9LEPT|nr:hypothetical protein [Leptospira gomenensis]TGK31757.1 hypothetical protein EHQ17_13320 [Leptospira gomenensis]TGK36136.1 hypothetical protein EHQ12_14795 [Leptospira gomenensis]TGK41615.1 hypothetical protein EHQ07_16155 [Leptospira gomenensis]TGK61426.1 hypothetical protein EHQ13_08715 [Leptospira gomenensis]
MKENYNILNLPRDLREDLIGRKRIETRQGWFDLASIQEVHFSSVKIGPFANDELGQYYTNSVGLIKNSEHYGEDPEILIWLPRIGLYGTWDSSHDELHIFPDGNWNTMKSNLTPFIEAQWGYEGDDKIEHITLEDAERYPTAFDFIPYDLDKTVHNLSDGELNAFLERYEDAILRHPDVSSLDDAYFALAETYYRLGKKESDRIDFWRKKLLRILDYYPEGEFHREREGAEICVWASSDLGLSLFRNLLDKDEKQPEYAGGASLLSAFLIHFADRSESILEISKSPKYTTAVLRSLETAKRWALTVVNDELAAKLKQNSAAMETISTLVDRIGEIILTNPENYSKEEVHSIRHKKVVDRLVKGWEHLKKKEYTQTEELLRSIFSEYAEDAEALFLDARLHWLKTGSPEEGIKRAEKNLLTAAEGDFAGRGRLYNLVGCALDEMGKLKQSLDAFGKAAELCPRESMYAANLAEIYWKMGDQKQAAQYAKKAKSMGDKSSIVEEIFQSTRSGSKQSE